MSAAPGLVRPAARSAAVRPHSASSSSPRPAPPWSLGASHWRASLFFAPLAPALWLQSIWLASACRSIGRGGVVTVTPLVTPLVTAKLLQSLDIHAPLPRYHSSPAHVIRSRARACALLPLPLVTWEQDRIVYVVQWLKPFPRALPTPAAVVTWEQARGSALLFDRHPASANKVEAGYGDLQRPAGGAREKFRDAIARSAGVDQAQLLLVGRADPHNGGNPPFRTSRAGHVGRPMLEGGAQAHEFTAFPALRLKLGRLRGLDQAELAAGAIEPLALGGQAAVYARGTPGAPNRARASRAGRPLHAGRIGIEDAAQAAFSLGDYSNRRQASEKNPQTGDRWWGPGGARLWKAANSADRSDTREAGKQAGVSIPSALSLRSHETGEGLKLRRQFAAVNGLAA